MGARLLEADTLELAASDDERIEVAARAIAIETEADSVARSLQALAVAAVRHGPVDTVTWGSTAVHSSSRRSPRRRRASSSARSCAIWARS